MLKRTSEEAARKGGNLHEQKAQEKAHLARPRANAPDKARRTAMPHTGTEKHLGALLQPCPGPGGLSCDIRTFTCLLWLLSLTHGNQKQAASDGTAGPFVIPTERNVAT